MRKHLLFSLFAVGLGTAGDLHADADDDQLSPFVQELLLSNSGDNQQLGEWQWAVSGHYSEFEQSSISTIATELEYGITSKLTLGIELPYVAITPEQGNNTNGIGNLELSALYRIAEDDDYYLSLAVERSFNTSANAVSSSQEDGWEFDLIYLTQIADNHQLKASFITELEDNENSHQIALAWLHSANTVAIAVELNWYDSVDSAEQEGVIGQDENSDDAWQIAFSAVWQYDNEQEIQLGMPIGLSGDIADWGLTLNWSVEWE